MTNENDYQAYDEAYDQKLKEVGEALDGADLPVVLGVTLTMFCSAMTQITQRDYLVRVVNNTAEAIMTAAKVAEKFQQAAQGQPNAPETLQ